ncbi:Peptide chain release factor subunit 1 [Candidatus Gugararchaeum adminiculabundum]|nr:Peptide chain release factor subunit 1 [Candidatus Gugararchaeum adminiculabundum]
MGRESGLAVYGMKEVNEALEYSAVQDLLLTDELLRSNKEVERLAEKAQRNKVKLNIFSTENDAGKQLKGLSGIAALLRFKIR